MAEPLTLFVYGTLMRGEHHHDQLAGAQFLGMAATEASFDLVLVDYYPALLRGGQSQVLGELYGVDAPTLQRLDQLEEVPHYYVREGVRLADGRSVDSYVLPRDRLTSFAPIPTGSFRSRA